MSDKLLRAADAYLAGHPLPERHTEPSQPIVTLDPNFEVTYNMTPASEIRQKYQSDPLFKAQVDLLLSKGESNVL